MQPRGTHKQCAGLSGLCGVAEHKDNDTEYAPAV